jgi:hypothetical protein
MGTMTARPLSKTRAALQLIATGLLACGGQASAEEPITAVFKVHELSFDYRSNYQFYSCHELQRRVANMLMAMGARDDVDVKARNCEGHLLPSNSRFDRTNRDPLYRDNRSDPMDRWNSSASSSFGDPDEDQRQQAVQLRVRVMMPVELTPAVMAEIEKDKSRRELVSRVTRNPAASFNDPVVFAARREQVTLSQSTIRLQPEDCELVDQMTRVLRKLDVRVIRRSSACNARNPSRIPPQLVVEALVPTGALMPMPDPEKMKQGQVKADQDKTEQEQTDQGPSADAEAETPTEPAAQPPPQ